MPRRHASAVHTCAAAIALASSFSPVLFAQEPSEAEPTTHAASEEQSPRPLMDVLSTTGLGQALKDANISIFGHAQSSYTRNFDRPRSGENVGRLFDSDDDKVLLNQLDLTLERTVDPSAKKWDLGGRIEWLYGSDAGFIHANGLFDWYDDPRDPQNQLDLYQAYVDLAVPVGNGLQVRVGKFQALPGWESINPAENDLFSHSYLFNFTEPSTATGALAVYALSDAFTLTAGVTRGWDQSLEDTNDAIDYLVSGDWTIREGTTLSVALSLGPQRDDNSRDYRTSIDVILDHAVSNRLSVALHGNFGHDANALDSGGDAVWYGLAGYATYTLNDYLSIGGRAEWFCDQDGFLTNVAANYYEATVGLNIRPLPHDRWGQSLVIRPELRADFSDEHAFNGGEDRHMFTAGVDVVYSL